MSAALGVCFIVVCRAGCGVCVGAGGEGSEGRGTVCPQPRRGDVRPPPARPPAGAARVPFNFDPCLFAVYCVDKTQWGYRHASTEIGAGAGDPLRASGRNIT